MKTKLNLDPLFGDTTDSIPLKNAPLIGVLFQVKFPRIARITEESYIANFQDSIRTEYPHFRSETRHGVEIEIIEDRIQPQKRTDICWRFLNVESTNRITLSANAITFETKNYTNRDESLNKFTNVLENFIQTINPIITEQLGVRYINQLHGDATLSQLESLIRTELLNTIMLNKEENIEFLKTDFTGKTAEGKIIAQYGFMPPNITYDIDLITPIEQISWILDIDSLCPNMNQEFKTELVVTNLDNLAARAYTFFRWCISEEFLTHFGAQKR